MNNNYLTGKEDGRKKKRKQITNNKKIIITYEDINKFEIESKKKDNDNWNKIREQIICDIINKEIPEEFYINGNLCDQWKNLRENINKYLEDFRKRLNIKKVTRIDCIKRGGRTYNYDFEISFYCNKGVITYNIEFKFNCDSISNCPQFSSPCKPSKYLFKNFESWFYDNHLSQISKYVNLDMPDKKEYIKTINNNDVECMKEYKKLYDENKNFKKKCRDISREAINEFVSIVELDIEKLSDYLKKSQNNKHYMLYKNGNIYYDSMNENIYEIINIESKNKMNFICKTKSKMKLQVKLRFKNGCGLQFPAFQISRKIPLKKDLINICIKNNIFLDNKSLVKDIKKKLDENNIIY
jgi:hypothetical protein